MIRPHSTKQKVAFWHGLDLRGSPGYKRALDSLAAFMLSTDELTGHVERKDWLNRVLNTERGI